MPITHTKVKQVEEGIWLTDKKRYLVDFRPVKSKQRFRKIRKTKAEAREYKQWVIANYANDPEWRANKKEARDTRKLSELVDLWFNGHGKALENGDHRKNKLIATCQFMGDPAVADFCRKMFVDYRSDRAEEVKLKTVNNEHGYLCSMINTLIEMEEWKGENPIQGVTKFKMKDSGLVYLDDDQMRALLKALDDCSNTDLPIIVELCLSTGARWSEAAKLHSRNLKSGAAQYVKTKTGQSRWVGLTPKMEKKLRAIKRKDGFIFEQKRTEHQFEDALKRAGITLPEGQCTHVLRHTFATHYLANGGDVRALQDILGHTNLKTTMRYVKVVNAMRDKVIHINPLAMLESKAGEVANDDVLGLNENELDTLRTPA